MEKLIHTPEGELKSDNPYQLGRKFKYRDATVQITEEALRRQADMVSRERDSGFSRISQYVTFLTKYRGETLYCDKNLLRPIE